MAGKVCDVCGAPSHGVASSSAARGSSYAYCADCLIAGLEPYDAIVALAFCCSGLDGLVEGYDEIIDKSLAKVGKTREDALADAKKIEEEYIAQMKGETNEN